MVAEQKFRPLLAPRPQSPWAQHALKGASLGIDEPSSTVLEETKTLDPKVPLALGGELVVGE